MSTTLETPTAQNPAVQEILSKALTLPDNMRLFIAHTLWDSTNYEVEESRDLEANEDVDPEIDAAWRVEIKRRIDDVRSGRVKMIDGDVFLNKIRKQIRK